jgi:HK97 family phage major capsid protein
MKKELKELLEKIQAVKAGTEEGDILALVEQAEGLKAKIDAEARLDALMLDIDSADEPSAPSGAIVKSKDTDVDVDIYAGFGEYGEADYMRAVYKHAVTGEMDPRLSKIMAAAPQNPFDTRDANVSFPRPEGFQSKVEEYDFDSEDEILKRFNIEPTGVGRIKYVRNELDSGLTAYWDDELDQLTESKMDYQKASLEVGRMTVATSASNEELRDFPKLRAMFNKEAPRAMNKKHLNANLTGDGVAKPNAYLTGGHVIDIAKDAGQTADTISETNVIGQYARFMNGAGSFVLANHNTLPQIMQLSLNGDSIWTPRNEGFKVSPGGSLLGIPIVLNDYAETLGDAGDLVFVNPRGYKGLRLVGGIKSAMSEHIYFDRHASMFIWLQWVGGEAIFENPYDPANSTGKQGSTRSHVVRIAARA